MNACRSLVAILVPGLLAALLSTPALAAEKKGTKFARFEVDGVVAYGIVEGDRVRQIDGDLFGRWKPTDKTHALADVKLLVPTVPTKVLACAGNYKSHLGDAAAHPYPEMFFKVPSCLIACCQPVVIPKDATNVHYEAELVIVIGRRAKNVPVDRALDHVLGVTCGNDISARDWQKNDVQWWRAKGSDTFGPCGPWIVSGVDYDDLLLELRQNGEVRQKERTSNMEHGVAAVVSWASRHVTLEPGDLIFTGTAGKTSAIEPGDVLEVELEGVGILKNPVQAAE
ncbi:MAG TPA: fumarylacetoacetate hydrolase family protein [Thermoguttaceae bacterium]|nr:fumarylacetoacetate hydrolase family protein [Thermoguttaceae bacterium]